MVLITTCDMLRDTNYLLAKYIARHKRPKARSRQCKCEATWYGEFGTNVVESGMRSGSVKKKRLVVEI